MIDDCNTDSDPDSDLEIVSISCSSLSGDDDTRKNSDDESVNDSNNRPEKFFDDETCLLKHDKDHSYCIGGTRASKI